MFFGCSNFFVRNTISLRQVIIACGRRDGGIVPSKDNLLSSSSLAGPLPYPPGGGKHQKTSTRDSVAGASSSSTSSGDTTTPVVAAFVLPNRSIPATSPLAKFKVPLQQLEMWAGLELFPTLGDQGNVDPFIVV